MKISQTDLNARLVAHQAWLNNPATGAKLVLRNLDLSEAVFDNQNLTDAEINGCYLHKASFQNALMANTKFEHNLCNETLFNNATLAGVDLTATFFWYADMRGAVKTNCVELRTEYRHMIV